MYSTYAAGVKGKLHWNHQCVMLLLQLMISYLSQDATLDHSCVFYNRFISADCCRTYQCKTMLLERIHSVIVSTSLIILLLNSIVAALETSWCAVMLLPETQTLCCIYVYFRVLFSFKAKCDIKAGVSDGGINVEVEAGWDRQRLKVKRLQQHWQRRLDGINSTKTGVSQRCSQ